MIRKHQDHTTLRQHIRRFPTLRVLVIGDPMLDTYMEGYAERLCSEGPVPVVQKTTENHVPGGAANTAVNVRALGATVFFLGLLGSDQAGQQLRRKLRQCDVDDQWLVEDAEAPTLQKMRILANGHYVVRVDEGSPHSFVSSPHYAQSQQRLLLMLEEAYHQSDLVLVSDYRYGVLSAAIIDRLTQLQVLRPLPLLIDSKALPRFHQLPATVITPNILEARQMVEATGGVIPSGESTNEPLWHTLAAHLLSALPRVNAIALTLGKDGVYLLDRRECACHLLALPVAHAHDVGAGDVFAAAMALALATTDTLPDAAHIGLIAASIAVARPGTSIVHLHELENYTCKSPWGEP